MDFLFSKSNKKLNNLKNDVVGYALCDSCTAMCRENCTSSCNSFCANNCYLNCSGTCQRHCESAAWDFV